jgi:hypothetical protein
VIFTKSASDLVPIFLMMCPRCIFTVISAMPISAAICLFISRVKREAQTGNRGDVLESFCAWPQQCKPIFGPHQVRTQQFAFGGVKF